MKKFSKIIACFVAMIVAVACQTKKEDKIALNNEAKEELVKRPASYEAAPEALKIWVDARAGTGEAVHWIADGSVYEYPSGKKLFGMIGFDSSTIIWPEEAGGEITHLTRKTFAYTDPETGEVIKEYNGNEVKPIAYPYQMITYRLENDRIYGDVEQGVGERVQKIKSKDGIPFRKLGDTYIYNAQVYLDFPLPTGKQYQAWENYDFFVNPEGSIEEPHQMTWQRYGQLPSWAGGGPAIIHLHSWRVESHDEFPPKLLEWAKADKPNWLNPPKDIAEVRTLQKGEGGPGWGQ
ncbi:DUF1838 family protein [Spongiivirga sp. MCCC 1A20706]|uniref:DUF1838 family protein n=1 Tax=Spongiivirga sp. MCCC 1A20706 TaxID=3160963 RepID=UPI0039779661